MLSVNRLLGLAILCSSVCAIARAAGPPPEDLTKIDEHNSGHKLVIQSSLNPSAQTFSPYVGRLYFKADGGLHYCTAQFVEERILLTAAHCTRDSAGTAYTDFCYIPPNVTPPTDLGGGNVCPTAITATCVASNPNWLTAVQKPREPDNRYLAARFDYAFLRMAAGGAGANYDTSFKDLSKANKKDLFVVGYPSAKTAANIQGSSHTLYFEKGGFKDGQFTDLLHAMLWAAGTTESGFGSGVSGGAWFHLKNNTDYEIVSVNSSYVDNSSYLENSQRYRLIYGTQFDVDTGSLRDAAKNQTSDCQ